MTESEHDANETIAKMNMLKPGESIVYHTGMLAFDRAQRNAGASNINAVAGHAWGMCQNGLVNLTQHKMADGVYEYTATCRR